MLLKTVPQTIFYCTPVHPSNHPIFFSRFYLFRVVASLCAHIHKSFNKSAHHSFVNVFPSASAPATWHKNKEPTFAQKAK